MNLKDEEDLSVYNPMGSELRKAQLKMLDILNVVSKICDNNNIPYWLSFGTLLGAVRHKGFIPWDDDLDIEVEQKDFKKLMKCLELELPETMKLQFEGNDPFYFHKFAKVRDLKSVVSEKLTEDFKYKGVFIDIFPREYSITFLKTIALKLKGESVIYLKNCNYLNKRNNIFKRAILNVRIVMHDFIIWFSKYLSKLLLLNKLFTPFLNKGINKDIIFPLSEIVFEGYTFKCPRNSDKYLKLIYGDYMKIPAIDKRMMHTTKIEFLE